MRRRRASRLLELPLLMLLMRRAFCAGVSRGAGRGAPRMPAGAPKGLKAKQSLGQNFLQDTTIARRLVEGVTPAGEGGDRVLELGPGQGALTSGLLERFPRMTAVEIDERMVEHLRGTLPALSLVHADLLDLDLGSLAAERGGQLSLVSNTPYYLTSPLLFKCLGSLDHVESALLTMQREVAQKVLSPPSSKNYGVLSVMLQLFAAPERLFDIPPEAFAPAPKITSSALRLTLSAVPLGETEPLSAQQRAALLGLLKLTFESRRKMLRVSLRALLEAGAVHSPPAEFLTKRPEQLEPAAWLELARGLLGESLGADGETAPMLERHAVSKAWRAHKAGYQ